MGKLEEIENMKPNEQILLKNNNGSWIMKKKNDSKEKIYMKLNYK